MEPTKRTETTRDERRDIHALRAAGHTYKQIADLTGRTARQVQYAPKNPVSPSKRTGRPSKLTEA